MMVVRPMVKKTQYKVRVVFANRDTAISFFDSIEKARDFAKIEAEIIDGKEVAVKSTSIEEVERWVR